MTKDIITIGQRARQASLKFALASTKEKNALLVTLASLIASHKKEIIAANKKDLLRQGKNHPFFDRLMLDSQRLDEICKSILAVTKLTDPVGELLDKKRMPSGIVVSRRRVAIGVLGVIYEARPNVTIEISSLGLKTGNAIILKGGKEANYSNQILVRLIQKALTKHGFSKYTVQSLDPTQRQLVAKLIRLNKYVDVIVPRGGKKLIDFVRDNSSVPIIETGAGVCHTYVEKSVDLAKAVKIVVNAKVQRPTVCNALDTLILDRSIAKRYLPLLAAKLAEHKVLVRVDAASYIVLKEYYPNNLLKKSKASDFGKEFLSLEMSVKIVDNFEQAIDFIQKYSSGHSEAILTKNTKLGEKFLRLIDAAAVYVNTSTRFTDGFQFGLGAEVGISTQKLHTRGPMGLEALTSTKWIIKSDWKIRM